MTQVKVKVRPDQAVRFPGLCVHCAQAATERMALRKRIGRLTRTIDVPLCADCAQTLNYRAAEEERWLTIGRLVAGFVFFLALALSLLLTPTAFNFALRLLTALTVALVAGAAVYLLFRHASFKAALPAKKAIYGSARIVNFSWRATTFAFDNSTFAERFRMLNESRLMDI